MRQDPSLNLESRAGNGVQADISIRGTFPHQAVARTQVAVIEKTGQTAYPLWDLSVTRSEGRIRPYLRLANLSNTGYEEISGVPLPGRSIMGGVAYVWTRKDR